MPSPLLAQTTGASGVVEEIVVTARRREESLQDVPVAITALTAEDITRTGLSDLVAVGQAAPNVTLEVSRGTNTTLSAFIRGVGQQDPVAGF
ncbi:MAG: TonB-dependent receptor plug domain-containing protein, partial [Pseudomonadota bacterium]